VFLERSDNLWIAVLRDVNDVTGLN
jgi:hypothetical protein